MMEVSVCLCGTRVSQVNLDKIAALPGPSYWAEARTGPSMRQWRVHEDARALHGASRRAHGGGKKQSVPGRAGRQGDVQWSRLLKPASITSPLASWPLGRSGSAPCSLESGGASWSSEPGPEPCCVRFMDHRSVPSSACVLPASVRDAAL